MGNQKRIVPSWIRTISKIGLVMFAVLALASALVGNWVVAAGMVVMAIVQITTLVTTRTKPLG